MVPLWYLFVKTNCPQKYIKLWITKVPRKQRGYILETYET